MDLIVTPIVLSRDRETEKGNLDRSNPIDAKMRGLALGRIGTSKHGLLPSSFVPQIALDLAIHFEGAKRKEKKSSDRAKGVRMIPVVRKAPIGLWPVEPEGWLNALMQFVLFLPRFVELFYFAPKSFSLFRDYIDRYRDDQEDCKEISSANGSSLLRLFSIRLSVVTLKEVFYFLKENLGAKWEGEDEFFVWDSAEGKFFIRGDGDCYELDAFIELRPDEKKEQYVAYGKIAGTWYQCDNEQIVSIRSNFLHTPLERVVLCHYKRVIV